MKVLLVDDEKTIRDGLKVIIDWQAYGFDEFLEGEDGSDGLAKMIGFSPELTLLDIRMPKMSGLEAAEQARKAGYDGKIILLSGYSDFKYAQSAINIGVDAYVLKSIDENELAAAVQKVREDIERKAEMSLMENKNVQLARNSLLCDVLLGLRHNEDELIDMHISLKSGVYRVVLFDFCKDTDENRRKLVEDILKCSLTETQAESVTIDGRFAMILNGDETVSRLPEAVRTARRRACIPIFAGMGRIVNSFNEITLSYLDARQLVEDKFFYNSVDDIICFEGNPCPSGDGSVFDPRNYLEKIQTYVEAGELEKIKAILGGLRQRILMERVKPEKVKGILSNLYIDLLGKLQSRYPDKPCELPTDSGIVNEIFDMDYLNDIIGYLEDEFGRISSGITVANGDIAAKIFSYIDKNSSNDLKLESLAALFNYNSNYLGKLIKKAKGESFNTYLEKIRIRKAEALLSESGLKVYEICERVGYRNLNYFYKKFKKYTGRSASEYRDNIQK